MRKKREDISDAEWIEIFQWKDNYAKEQGLIEVSPRQFYRELFPIGSLQEFGDRDKSDGKGCIIATQVRTAKMKERYPDEKTHRWNVYDDLSYLDKVIGDRFGLIAPISFFGKSHKRVNAHEMFAFAIDVDYVDRDGFRDLIYQCQRGLHLMPTYIVSSGKGVHVYYFLESPVPMYAKHIRGIYKEIKKKLVNHLWNSYVSLSADKDAQSVVEGMRCVGSQTKLREDIFVKAYKISDKRYTIDDFLAKYSIDDTEWKKPHIPKQIAFDDLSELKSDKQHGYWTCKTALYDWWKRRIEEDSIEGGRYFAIMALCAYGLKCGVPIKTIKEDAYGYVPLLDSRTKGDDNHFTTYDVDDALKCLLGKDNKHLTHIAGREWISEKTKIEIKPTHRPRGKRLKQRDHLELARMSRDIRQRASGTKWTDNSGRPTSERIVIDWRLGHPNGKKIECHRETGLSRVTIDKWWDSYN